MLKQYIKFRERYNKFEWEVNARPTPNRWDMVYRLRKIGEELEELIDYNEYRDHCMHNN